MGSDLLLMLLSTENQIHKLLNVNFIFLDDNGDNLFFVLLYFSCVRCLTI